MTTKHTKTYTAVIVGAGRIASGFDEPTSKHVLTHAHAVKNNKKVSLVGICDIDDQKGKAEAKKWGTTYFGDLESMMGVCIPDIVIIASPDDTHTAILSRVLHAKPKIVICEKPIVTTREEIPQMRKLVRSSGVPVITNFRRRFDPTVEKIREDILKGVYGEVISANAIYTKGILHNAAHFIDLARYFFGEMTSGNMCFAVNDFPEGSPSLGGVATFERCPQFYLMSGDERHFSIAEFEIIAAKRRFRFLDEGFRLMTEEVIPDPIFKGYFVLGKQKIVKTQLVNSMSALISHAVGVIEGNEQPKSEFYDALRTHEACFKLLKSKK